MEKQKLQNPRIDTPKLEPSLYEPDVYVKVKDMNYFIQLSNLSSGERETFVDTHLATFEEIFKLAVTQVLTRGLENPVVRSKIDTTKSVEIPIQIKEKMNRNTEFESNVAAFKAMERQLEADPKYRGKYVAIYKGQLIAHGDDRKKLLSDAYTKYGYVPLIVHKVGEKRIVHMYSPHFKRNV